MLHDTIVELGRQLEVHYPSIPAICCKHLDSELAENLSDYLLQCLSGRLVDDKDEPAEYAQKRLMILCAEDHPFVQMAQEDNPRAHWGIAVPRQFSVAWVNNKYLWWHEALHLFNAKDCYNRFGINKCQQPHCVMQASPTVHSCGGRLHLCSKNIRRLSEFDPEFDAVE